MVSLRRATVLGTTVLLAACSGAQEGLFRISGDEYSVNPKSLSSLTTYLSASSTDQITVASPSVTEWASEQGDSFTPESGKEPDWTTDSLDKWLTFAAGDNLSATGRLPEHLSKNFTFALVGVFDQAGLRLRLGSDDETEAMLISIPAAGQLKAEHSSSSGNKRTRTWTGLPTDDQPHALAIVFGEATKDMELYVDGFRNTTYSSSGSGSASSFQTVARDFKLSNEATGSETFRLGELLVFNEKLGPQTVYGISRYLARARNIVILGITNKEIRNNTTPLVEPESVDASYIFAAVLTPKCVSCHQTGGYSPVFENETLLRSAVDALGALIVNPGNSASSALYTSVENNSCPSEEALSARLKNS
ncbi:MAG: hypothetical protein HC902_14545 [Calothrix sp. SM1_5_4]|nr:hypothetical protein [Calothrix sp. SM1_5_4]